MYCLINGLEQVLAKAHACLNTKDIQLPKLRSTEQPQSFLGNVVSNVFATETQLSSGSATKNRRLILLGFHDTVRISFIIWHWGSLSRPIGLDRLDPSSAATLSYVSVKLRNRARRLLDHLFAAETLECLESLITPGTHWIVLPNEKAAIISLLQVLNSTRPKVSVMTLFNAIYSRTKPNALEATRKSSLISELAEIELATFMISYMASLEDDAMDEIWEDCIAFLRDVLSNPLPQRRILPLLLEFTTLLAEKIENTNFGDQPKMKRELGVSLS